MTWHRVSLSWMVAPALALWTVGCGGGGSGPATEASSGVTVGTGNSSSASQSLSISVTALQNVLLGQPMTQTLLASGGTPPYTWTATSALPPGLSLTPTGVISGTPTSVSQYNLGLEVTDSGSPQHSASAVLRLFVAFPISVFASIVPDGNVGLQYFGLLRSAGGFGLTPYSWQVQSGSLPPGLVLTSANSEGTLSGTPTLPGTYTFTVQVNDPGPPKETASQSFSIVIGNRVVIATRNGIPTAVLGRPYSTTLQAAGGTPPYTWSIQQGFALPSGLQLDSSSGVISGTATQVGSFSFMSVVTDSGTPPAGDALLIYMTVNPQLSFTSATLPDGILNRSYSAPLPFQGGAPPYTFQVVSGSLPPGITLPPSPTQGSPAPAFQGSPSQLGTSSFTLRVTDSENSPVTIQGNFNIRVNIPLVGPSLVTVPNAIVGTPYSFAGFSASGGLPPYNWGFQSSASGSPPGLSVDPATGRVFGTPMAPFSGSLCVQVSDSSVPAHTWGNCPAFEVYARVQVATSNLPPVVAGAVVSLKLAASGGIEIYTWTLISQNLPPGLIFDAATGTISGQTGQIGTFSLTVQVSDAGPPSQTSSPATLQLSVTANPGRNDSPGTATPLSNGTYGASISPIADPPTGVANPDSDYYKLTASPGAFVIIEITAQRLNPPSPLDSVLEIVDATNTQIAVCNSNPNATPLQNAGPYNQPCVNDDLEPGFTTDSKLVLQVPATNVGPLTFYAHVLDFRGDARPDFIYTITITGAN